MELTYRRALFTLGFVSSLVIGFLPLLVNHYTWLPGDDWTDYLSQASKFPAFLRYYGATILIPLSFLNLPVTSLQIYYYSTFPLIYLGLYYSLIRYHLIAPVFAFVILIFMTSPILMEMEASTFVSQIGFFALFLPSLFFIIRNPKRLYTHLLLLVITLLFHTLAGMFLSYCYLTLIITKNLPRRYLMNLVPPSIIAVTSGVYLQASTAQITQAFHYTYTSYMPLDVFLKLYLGPSTFVFVTIVFLIAYNARFNPLEDPFLLSLMSICLAFSLLAFIPQFHLNSDRMSKYLVDTLVVISVILSITSLKVLTQKYKRKARLVTACFITFTLLLLSNTFLHNLNFWIDKAGSYNCIAYSSHSKDYCMLYHQ
jgi:hypothetical protein